MIKVIHYITIVLPLLLPQRYNAFTVTTHHHRYHHHYHYLSNNNHYRTHLRQQDEQHTSSPPYSDDDDDNIISLPPSSTPISEIPRSLRGVGVGIDLGTTNSCISILRDDDRVPIIIPTKDGRTLPSVVCFPPSSDYDDDDDNPSSLPYLVGKDAMALESLHPGRTYRNVKRVIGTGGETAAKHAAIVPNLFLPPLLSSSSSTSLDNNSNNSKKRRKKKKLTLDRQMRDAVTHPATLSLSSSSQRLLTPSFVSSRILHHLFALASHHARRQPITRCVIGIPAYFTDEQRSATLRAAREAGMGDRVRLIREPEAAALAYGVGRERMVTSDDDDGDDEWGGSELVLAFDLGGGTFDVSVLEVGGGVMEVVATGGDGGLGGSDFDVRVADWMRGVVVREEGSGGGMEGTEVRDVLVRCGEAVRVRLSSTMSVKLALPKDGEGWLRLERARDVIVNDEDAYDEETHVLCELTRKEMENLCIEEFLALLRPVREVAIMAGVLLPGDARPNVVEAALAMEEERDIMLSFASFYDDDNDDNDTTTTTTDHDNIDSDALLQIQDADLKALKREQQKGRKRARTLAKSERKFRAEKQKAAQRTTAANNNPSQIKSKKDDTSAKKVRDGIHGRPLSQIVLVGGATKMPAIGRLLTAVTGVVPRRTVNPDEAVALGCAVQVGILDGDDDGVGGDGREGMKVLTPMQAAIVRALAEKKGMNVNTM